MLSAILIPIVITRSYIGVADGSVAAIYCLIILLSAFEILSGSKLWNKNLSQSLRMAILPFIVVNTAIVAFNLMGNH
jgi:hypothetical protein